jgi:CRISPR-associated protein Csd2
MSDSAQSNERNIELHHKLVTLPSGKREKDVVAERHEMVMLIEVAKSNPNGDPDTGNMPRLQPDTLKGLMTDVCLKRKVRNFFSLYNTDGSCMGEETPRQGNAIFIRENAVLQRLMEDPEIEKLAKEIFEKELKQNAKSWDAKKKKKPSKSKGESESGESQEEEVGPAGEFKQRAYRDALCRQFFDLRAFGGVTSTEGPLKGSFYGQIRGPIQFGFAESLDRVLQLDFSITRCASASEKEKKQLQTGSDEESVEESGNRTMGRKHVVDYGIYRCYIYFSPAFAAKTGFTYYDLDNFLFALKNMFKDDKAAARTGIRFVGLIDFEHSTALGNEHAHKLFEMVKVHRADVDENGKVQKEFPNSIEDYWGEAPEGAVREKNEGGEGNELVTARKIIWEIPACPKKDQATQN